ncbi:CNNM domain-containing protein [Mycoplasmoides genitalium]
MDSAPSGLTLTVIILSIILLAFISTVVSAYETAITSLTPYRWKNYIKTNNKQDKLSTKIINHFQNHYSSCLITILITNNIVAIMVSNILFLALEQTIKNELLSSVLNLVVSGVLIVSFCEILPKTLGRINVIRTLVLFAYLVYFFYLIFWPITKLTSLILKKYENPLPVSRKDVYYFIDEIEQNGLFSKEDSLLIKKTLIFDQVLVKKVMIKWKKVAYCYLNDSINLIAKQFLQGQFSRMPVVDKTTNKIVGFIHLKDFFTAKEANPKSLDLNQLLYPVVLVQDSTPIKQALRQMRLNRAHLAVVNDKHEKTIGIVSMEDIIEELVGEIYDEHDDIQPIQVLDENVWLVLPNVKAAYFFNKWIKPDLVKSKNITIQHYLASLDNDSFACQNKLDTPLFSVGVIADSEDKTKILYEIRKKSDVIA